MDGRARSRSGKLGVGSILKSQWEQCLKREDVLITAVISQPDVHWITKFGGTCFDGRPDNSLELQHF